jgi:antitoxin CptB
LAFSEEDRKRMLWHSRRGMLELDLVLVPFAERHLAVLDEEQLRRYRLLLEQEDQDLFGWFLRRGRPGSIDLAEIVDFILARHIAEGAAHLDK